MAFGYLEVELLLLGLFFRSEGGLHARNGNVRKFQSDPC